VTDDGVVLVDPPSEPNLAIAADALKLLTPKAVRWVAFSNPRAANSTGARFYADQGTALLAGGQLHNLAASLAQPGADGKSSTGELPSFPWLVFGHEIRLFPSNLEIRITALQHPASTGADVVLYVPSERVLFAGAMLEAARFPDIDVAVRGKAVDWVDGLKEIVDSIPVLKPAIGQAKVDPKLPEKTLEEGIAVVTSRGELSNLQNMKDLLSAAQKVRTDISKAVKSGRSCDSYLDSARANIFRVFGNFDAYAAQLCRELSSEPANP
jgi:hypothetical protein